MKGTGLYQARKESNGMTSSCLIAVVAFLHVAVIHMIAKLIVFFLRIIWRHTHMNILSLSCSFVLDE